MTFSITPASLSQLPEASVAVCAHDAGAASHLAAWLAPLQPQLRLCLSGPAEGLFKSKLGSQTPLTPTLTNALEDARVLISGTSWASDLEHQARLLARERGIPSVAVLDHWVNYQERFWRDGQELLPDQLWVADSEAAKLAKATFPDAPVLQLPNNWIKQLVQEVSGFRGMPKPTAPKYPAKKLLYLAEPIRDHKSGKHNGGEFEAMNFWLDQMNLLIKLGIVCDQQSEIQLYLRPHPSEPKGKYDSWIGSQAKWNIKIDNKLSLAQSLANADIAFGAETQALVAAIACHLPCFSTLPPTAASCRLPHSEIIHLSRLKHD